MVTFVVAVHIVVCFVVILVVLLQAGKGASMGSFMGGSSQTVFGSSGPGTFLGKFTAGAAVLFMLTSLLLSNPSFFQPERRVVNRVAEGQAVPLNQQQQALPIIPLTPAESGK